jgi:exonuclease III
MKGIFWNIRGFNQLGRKFSLEHLIRDNHVQFIGVQETKKEDFSISFLKNLAGAASFTWNFLPAVGTAGGILVGTRDDYIVVSNVNLHTFDVSCHLLAKNKNFSWKLVVVYDPAYDDKKVDFIDELHRIMASWQGRVLMGRDFNSSRFTSDKNNGRINQRFVDCLTDWINRWDMIELNPSNKKYTWSNNQNNLVLAKLDSILVTTNWEVVVPLVRVTALPKDISDHNPLLVDFGYGGAFGKKKFRFEKWCMELVTLHASLGILWKLGRIR